MEQKATLDTIRHSCAHVMAQAVKELWPETKIAIGPSIDNGFYYDFDKKEPFSESDFQKIEEVMHRIILRDLPFRKILVTKEDAIKLFNDKGEKYKDELLQNIKDKEISIYKTGEDFFDLCRGPHVESTGQIKAFKLLSVAGAYWRGDETRPMLQRIYGACFSNKEELNKYLHFLEEAKKRDHRKLATQLDLFHVYYDTAGAGLIFYHPSGALLRKMIEDYVRDQHLKKGYEMVITPNILKWNLWEQSGHAEYYKENMYYFSVDNEEYAVKPMNCPGHMLIYKSKIRSYRDLPIRYFELGTVYRREKAGVLHGLLRVRGFTQDDAHIFCREEQIKIEVMKVLDFSFEIMHDFGFNDFDVELSTQPGKFIGRQEDWDTATRALEESLKEKKIEYQVNVGDGAFYGPKIDIKLKDALQRSWQCATIQCDFSLPERFNLSYTNESGESCRPIIIHRAILGSLERFIGTLIEHYAGAFPVWLSPIQVMIIPIKAEHSFFAEKVKEDLQTADLRVIIDARNETLNKRIRESSLKKIPYVLVVGNKEVEKNQVAVRKRFIGGQADMTVRDFIQQIQKDINLKM